MNPNETRASQTLKRYLKEYLKITFSINRKKSCLFKGFDPEFRRNEKRKKISKKGKKVAKKEKTGGRRRFVLTG